MMKLASSETKKPTMFATSSASAIRPSGVNLSNDWHLPHAIKYPRSASLTGFLYQGQAGRVTPAKVALAWLLLDPQVIVTPGARSMAQFEANAATLPQELMLLLWRPSRFGSDRFVCSTGPPHKPP